jgi:hypothetical protein
MEEDVIRFPGGVHQNAILGAGLIGMVALREERTASHADQRFIDIE